MTELIKVVVALSPVFALMTALILLDSYKLVTLRSVILAILAGATAAFLSLFLHTWLSGMTSLDTTAYSRYAAPIVEEGFKAIYIVILLRLSRIGFMVDAAIYGFAVGAGFAVVENVFYLMSLEDAGLLVWIVRGFGTAAIHQSTMAVFAVITKNLMDRHRHMKAWIVLPGFLLAMITHSLYNHFIISPTTSTVIILVLLPLLVIVVFERSERVTREWLGVGFDADQEMLRTMSMGEFPETRIGQYLETLRARFPGTVVADMFCLLRLHAELALRAKGIMMMRQTGIRVPYDPEIQAKLDEMRFLDQSIGKTGKLAILPLRHTSGRDLWQMQKLS